MNPENMKTKSTDLAGNDHGFLLRASKLLGSLKSRRQLYRVINHDFRNYFRFNSSTLFVLNEGRDVVFNYFVDEANEPETLFCRYTVISGPGSEPDTDHIRGVNFEEISRTKKIGAYLKNQQIPEPDGLIVNLYQNSVICANWVLIMPGESSYGAQQSELLQITANLIGSALERLRSNELLTERDKESEVLQSLNIDFAAVREKNDLLLIIQYKLKKLFDFGYHWVAVVNDDVSALSSYLQDSIPNVADYPCYQDAITASYPINKDNILSKVLGDSEPQVFDLEQLNHRGDMPAYMKVLHAGKVKRTVITSLQVGKQVIGIWAICLTENQQISIKQLNMVKSISNQLSTVIANLLANDEISRREKERELLLSLNIDIAAVRHQNELLSVISRRLKTIIGFNHMFIGKINQADMTTSAFLLDPDSISSSHSEYTDVISEGHSINDGFIDKAFEYPGAKFFDLDELNKQIKLPVYLKLGYESGIKQVIATRFGKGINVFAFWIIYFEKKQPVSSDKLILIESVANQLSIAVSNILANEEIAKREDEKSKLLSFSNSIASIRDKEILGKLLKQHLRDMFKIPEYVIYYLSDDKKVFTRVLYDADPTETACGDLIKLAGSRDALVYGMFNKILLSEDPVFFDAALCSGQNENGEQRNLAEAILLRQMIGVSIRLGQENIAVTTFVHRDYHFIEKQYHLFKCILSQIALSISNIIANEKVVRQLTEINNYKIQLEEEKIYLKEEIETTHNYSEIVGESAAMQKTFRLVSQVAPSDSTVLILGETGTGKELIARAIHNGSPRKNKLMVKVNCAALPANLIESELFGHERGSFTGATERRLGKFELAHHGTLFLDEIGEMPLELQVKLLRALQEREIERVGGRQTIKVDVRIIAATNRDLEKEMAEGRFRSDLYYRLNIFPMTLPSLRDRKEDIPSLAMHFIHRFSKKAGKEIAGINQKALQELVAYPWPGNIRELEHLIERSVLLASGDTIKQIYLPNQNQRTVTVAPPEEFMVKTIDENERDFILKTLKYCGGRIGGDGGAAQLLGVPTSTLNSKIKRLGIKRDHHL